MLLKTLLVDDESLARDNLRNLLKEFASEYIEVVGEYASASEARKYIESRAVDLIFSDIEMPRENGVEFLESISHLRIPLIFVTGFNQYAIRAIQASAFDYLMKPIDIDELKRAVSKSYENAKKGKVFFKNDYPVSVTSMIENIYKSDGRIKKICIPHSKGLKMIDMADIVYLEADNNYTHVFLHDRSKFLVSKTLKEFENILEENMFYRIHKSSIINMSYLKEFVSEDGGYALLEDGRKIPISRRKIPEFMDRLRAMAKFLGNG